MVLVGFFPLLLNANENEIPFTERKKPRKKFNIRVRNVSILRRICSTRFQREIPGEQKKKKNNKTTAERFSLTVNACVQGRALWKLSIRNVSNFSILLLFYCFSLTLVVPNGTVIWRLKIYVLVHKSFNTKRWRFFFLTLNKYIIFILSRVRKTIDRQ